LYNIGERSPLFSY